MKKEIEKKIEEILKKIKENSFMKIENEEKFKKYLRDALEKNIPITFFNWECPTRFLDKTSDGRIFVNYDLDLEKIFNLEKYDDFTEFPRCVDEFQREKNIFEFLNSLKIPYRFVKLIADTNALYLNKESLKILGEEKVYQKFNEFKERVFEQVKKYPLDNFSVELFTEKFQDKMSFYNEVFQENYKKLKNKEKIDLLDKKFVELQKERTRKHMGMDDEKMIEDFTYRTIASYGAEGVIFSLFEKSNIFSNPVWLNIEEANERTKAITNFSRLKNGEEKLPMVFLK